jgi:Uma2 family endonuclease
MSRSEYQEIGVKEYWVIDGFRRTMTVFRSEQKVVVAEHETYRTELLPGFDLSPARLFAVAEGSGAPRQASVLPSRRRS